MVIHLLFCKSDTPYCFFMIIYHISGLVNEFQTYTITLYMASFASDLYTYYLSGSPNKDHIYQVRSDIPYLLYPGLSLFIHCKDFLN